jgi:selenocysteine lyase/cysteine desulfurase
VEVTDLFCLIGDALYWIRHELVGDPNVRRKLGSSIALRFADQIHHIERFEQMTYLDVVFNYGATPGENELRGIDAMREVYGIRQVQFNAKERTVRVEFDASRLKHDAVAKLLRQAGIDVREPVALA